MSEGTRVYSIRLDDELMKEVNIALERRNMHSTEEPWTLSDYIRAALRNKLAHGERGRRATARKRKGVKNAGGDNHDPERSGERRTNVPADSLQGASDAPYLL